MILWKIAKKSLWNRKSTTILSILSISLSVTLLLGIERIRTSTKESFASTVSGVHLIAGARSGPVNLLLYSVFRIGNATNNISYESYQKFTEHPEVEWSIPISLGDSHKGYRVVGTNQNYFKYYQYAGDKILSFSQGKAFEKTFDLVLGSKVAKDLNYKIGDQIILSHGTGVVTFQEHKDNKFRIVGILKPTGTPVDSSLHVSLQAIEAIHANWPGMDKSLSKDSEGNFNISSITAMFIKLKSRMSVFNVQREINDFEKEALMAIIPGVSLRDLWNTIGFAEKALLYVSFIVFIVSLMGMIISLLSTLNERRREMAILRAVGAKKLFIFSLLITEGLILSLLGIVIGVVKLNLLLIIFRPLLESKLGLSLGLFSMSPNEWIYLAAIIAGSLFAGMIPGWRAYRNSLSDGLIVKT